MIDDVAILDANLLIVDDLEVNVRLLQQMLNTVGYCHVTSTRNPKEVAPLHREHNYDLIILNLQTAGMDGFRVLSELKAIAANSYVPVLVITAEATHKQRALQAGAKDFVSKPFDLPEIKTRIHNLLEVRLLYKQLSNYNKVLEQTVLTRTAELRASEARFQRFTELSSDWYWEQDANGKFTALSGPALEMLGMRRDDSHASTEVQSTHWNEAERATLEANIAARRPFLDHVYSRMTIDGAQQFFQVSGEPIFDSTGCYVGYRGIGMEVTERMRPNCNRVVAIK